jgi:hypothetical protein
MADTPFATSAFGAHSVVATIDVINGIVAGVSKPFIAKVPPSIVFGKKTNSRWPICGLDLEHLHSR